MMTRRIRWTLVLFVVSILVAVGGGFFSMNQRSAYLKKLTKEVESWGAQVYIRYKSEPMYDPIRAKVGPEFVNSLVGIDGYYVEAPMNRESSSAQLRQLLEFQPLRSFDALGASNIDDEWVEAIPTPRTVQRLNLMATALTDRAVPRLLEMRDLSDLNIDHTAISDDGVYRLRELPVLARLQVGGKNFRAIRLMEIHSEALEDQTRPLGDRGGRIVGKLAIDERLGLPTLVEIMTFPQSGSSSFGGRVTLAKGETSGTYRFEIPLAGLPFGHSSVKLEVSTTLADRRTTVFCRLPVVSIVNPGSENSGLSTVPFPR